LREALAGEPGASCRVAARKQCGANELFPGRD
jgi:hypothetical protein